MVDVDVDVEDARIVAEEFEDAEDDVWMSMNQQGAQEGERRVVRRGITIYVAEPAGFTFFRVMQTPCPVDCHIAFPSI